MQLLFHFFLLISSFFSAIKQNWLFTYLFGGTGDERKANAETARVGVLTEGGTEVGEGAGEFGVGDVVAAVGEHLEEGSPREVESVTLYAALLHIGCDATSIAMASGLALHLPRLRLERLIWREGMRFGVFCYTRETASIISTRFFLLIAQLSFFHLFPLPFSIRLMF